MDLLDILRISSILTCSLLTGFIFTYAIIVMPGLTKLNDKEFIRAFQVTDAVIQGNQPLFILTWIGSIISLLSTVLFSIITFGIYDSWSLIFAGVVYLLGVQVITISIHLPLNNRIQKINIDELNDQMLNEERFTFETKWNYFNNIRTGVGFFVSLLLLLILTVR